MCDISVTDVACTVEERAFSSLKEGVAMPYVPHSALTEPSCRKKHKGGGSYPPSRCPAVHLVPSTCVRL